MGLILRGAVAATAAVALLTAAPAARHYAGSTTSPGQTTT